MNSMLRIENDVIIPLVEKSPVLWDTTLEVPKRKKAKRKAWKNICRELFEDFDGMDDEDKDEYLNGVKKRWQCLQDTFLKKKEEVLNKSGPRLKKYIYAEKMQFLDKIYNLVQSPSTINCSNGVSDEKSTFEPSQSKITQKLISLTEQNKLKTRKNLKSNNSKSHGCSFSESSEPVSSKVDRELVLQKKENVKHRASKKSKDIKSKGLSTKPPKHRTSKKRHNNTSTDGQFVAKKLCKKASTEKLSKNRLVDGLSEDKSTPKSYSREIFISKPLKDRLCENKPVYQFPKGKSPEDLPRERRVDQPCKCNITDQLSKNKLTNKPSKERYADKPLTDNLTDEPPKNAFANKPSDRLSEQPSILEVEDLVFRTDAIEQTTGGLQGRKHFVTQMLRPERMHTFNLLIQSVMPHLNEFDKSETLEFQMGVLQVIRDINNSREGPPTLIPEQFLDPITPSTSESWS